MAWLASYLSFGKNAPSPSAHRHSSPRPNPTPRSIPDEKIPVSPSVDGTLSPIWPGTPASDKTAVSHDTAAEAATRSLDLAIAQMKDSHSLRGTLAVLDAHETLGEVRSLIQKVRYQQAFQTPNVLAALGELSSVIDVLVACTRGSATSLTRFENTMNEIDEAAKNLRQQFPGHFTVSKKNKAVKAFQANAAIGLKASDERVITEARGNDAEGAVQINAPIFGDPAFLAQIAGAFGSK